MLPKSREPSQRFLRLMVQQSRAQPSLLAKPSQAELGAGFFEGDGLIDSHPKLEDSKHISNHYL